MTKYYPYGASLSKGQLEKLSRAYNNNSPITIRLSRNEFSGSHELMLTKTQINKLRKAMSQGTRSDIKISKTQIRKAVRQGGSLWGSLARLGSKLLPMAMPLVKKAATPLVTGALSGLASLGDRNVDKQYCEYLDLFVLIMPNEIKHYLITSSKKMVYSSDEIQERDSVLCGYWCLYYLLEKQKGRPLLDVIHNPKFTSTNQLINHQFLINYFM